MWQIYIKKKLNGRNYETKSMVIDDVLECITVGFRINRNKPALISCMYRCSGSNVLFVAIPWNVSFVD